MKGDFTRNTFNSEKHFSRVLMQQGRVQLDADWNEMVEMQLHFLRTLATDLIGRHGGPGDAFKLLGVNGNSNPYTLNIQKGHYYVDGILCEYDDTLDSPPQLTISTSELFQRHLLYLDVWERHLTYIEDENEMTPGIREVALPGTDTTTRTRIVWQVKSKAIPAKNELNKETSHDKFLEFLNYGETETKVVELSTGRLSARANKSSSDENNPCNIDPKSRYRGAENQLYRVEIHREGAGLAKDVDGRLSGDLCNAATFKWSRENGSVIFPIETVERKVITLENLGRDSRFGLRVDDWVEVVDDDYVLQNRAEALLQVKGINTDTRAVTLSNEPAADVGRDPDKHRFLRRWDHREPKQEGKGALLVVEGEGALLVVEEDASNNSDWRTLEDGVQILFPKPTGDAPPNSYRTGDYWLIPARVATGHVEWPQEPDESGNLRPKPKLPHGVEHHYAPLWIISVAEGKVTVDEKNDLRRTWDLLAKKRGDKQ